MPRSTVRLRVICWKSAYLTLIVTVRPVSALASQLRQTLDASASISRLAGSTSKISSEKVSSVPIDFFGRMGGVMPLPDEVLEAINQAMPAPRTNGVYAPKRVAPIGLN